MRVSPVVQNFTGSRVKKFLTFGKTNPPGLGFKSKRFKPVASGLDDNLGFDSELKSISFFYSKFRKSLKSNKMPKLRSSPELLVKECMNFFLRFLKKIQVTKVYNKIRFMTETVLNCLLV